LLLSEHEVATSTDCFPIEFHDIQARHRLLHGADVISAIVVDKSFYRAQVEHELRAKVLRLRQKAAGLLSDKDLLRRLLADNRVDCDGWLIHGQRPTSIKTRIIAHQQQMVRVDRETRIDLDADTTRALVAALDPRLKRADAVIVGDYGKGVVTQALLDELKPRCRQHGLWLSLDPKPVHHPAPGRTLPHHAQSQGGL
jgi:hypothetical protein